MQAILAALLEYASRHPEQSAAVVTGLAGALTHYRKTGKLPIGRLPYRALRQSVRDLRHRYGTKARPKGVPALVVDVEPSDGGPLATTLRGRYFEGTSFQYHYKGQVWGLRRPHGTEPDPQTGDAVPMELHVRAFRTVDDRALLVAHTEASRYEAQSLHLNGQLTSFDAGRDMMAKVLRGTDHDVQRIESERAAGIEVV